MVGRTVLLYFLEISYMSNEHEFCMKVQLSCSKVKVIVRGKMSHVPNLCSDYHS